MWYRRNDTGTEGRNGDLSHRGGNQSGAIGLTIVVRKAGREKAGIVFQGFSEKVLAISFL
jgi:hypothetical protein